MVFLFILSCTFSDIRITKMGDPTINLGFVKRKQHYGKKILEFSLPNIRIYCSVHKPYQSVAYY